MYTTTRCDYISFFIEIGKATFLLYLFQYTAFITAGNDLEASGTLANIQLDKGRHKQGFLAFIRL